MALDTSSLKWEVRQHHNTHFHSYLNPTHGNNILLDPAPSPEDFTAATESYLEVLLTATDGNGYANTTSVNAMPKIVTISFTSKPSGMSVLLDGQAVTTPMLVSSWVNHPLVVGANDQAELLFQSWSDGRAASHTITVGEATAGTTFTATYRRPCTANSEKCSRGSDCSSGRCSARKICRPRK